MGRPKKVQPAQSPSNPNMVQGFLAKARAAVEAAKDAGTKRRAEQAPEASPPVKAKASPPAVAKTAAVVVAKGSVPAPPVAPKSSQAAPNAAEAPTAKSTMLVPPTVRCVGKCRVTGEQPLQPKALCLVPPPPKPEAVTKDVSQSPSDSPATEASTASERTKAVLEKAKQIRLANQQNSTHEASTPTPKSVSSELVTPPPTKRNCVSPQPPTPSPVPKMQRLASGVSETSDWDCWQGGHSQREFYGSKGESWWGSGWNYYPGWNNWFYDHRNESYTNTWGDKAWTTYEGTPWESKNTSTSDVEVCETPQHVDSDDRFHEMWNDETPTHEVEPHIPAAVETQQIPSPMEIEPSNEPTEPAAQTASTAIEAHPTENDTVRAALAKRMPTNLSEFGDKPDSPCKTAVDAQPAKLDCPNSATQAPEASHPNQSQQEAKDNDNDDDDDVPGQGAEGWKNDKHGKPLKPKALYMRFYRAIRSF